jgi:hypothetical protein
VILTATLTFLLLRAYARAVAMLLLAAFAAHLMLASNVASHGEWSLWPMASDWLSTVGRVLGGEIAARLMSFTSLLLVVAMLRSLTRRMSSRSIGRLVAAVFASASLTFGLMQDTFTEMTLTAFVPAAFVAIAGVAGPLSLTPSGSGHPSGGVSAEQGVGHLPGLAARRASGCDLRAPARAAELA